MKVQNAAVKKMAVGGNVTSDPQNRAFPLRAFGAEGFSTVPGSNDDRLLNSIYKINNRQ